MLVPNTQPMLSQYWLPIPIQQQTFVGFKYHLYIDPTLVESIFVCLHPTKIQHCLSTLVKCCSNIGKKILVDKYFADVEQMLGANMFCLQSKQIRYWLSRLVQCWANVGKQILVYKCRVNVGQMLGANNLVPNTQPMLSQYLLRIQIQQYTFVGFKHHLNIDPTLVANIFVIVCTQQRSNIVCQHWSNVGPMLRKNYWQINISPILDKCWVPKCWDPILSQC